MGIEDVPQPMRKVAQEILDEFKLACEISDGQVEWLLDYDVLALRAPAYANGADLEVYLPRPLVVDAGNLVLASRKELLSDLRRIPARAADGEGRFWALREQGHAHPLEQRPFSQRQTNE